MAVVRDIILYAAPGIKAEGSKGINRNIAHLSAPRAETVL